MKVCWLVVIFLLPSLGLFAQRAPRSTFGSAHGFGNVVFPGTGHAPGVSPHPFSIGDTGFARRLARTVGGGNPYLATPNRGHGRAPVAVYPYPVYVGGYGNFGGYYQEPAPNVTVIAPPQMYGSQMYNPAPAAPVVINQYFSNAPSPRQNANAELGRMYEAPRNAVVESTSNAQRSFLVAFKDHAVYSAMAYWVEGDTLHYVTPNGVHNQASLDLIDREFTDKLNRERNVEFKLSGPK